MTIPSSYKVPGKYTEFDLVSGAKGFAPLNEQIVIIAQMDSVVGSAELLKPIQVFQASKAKELFGPYSIAYLMCEAIFEANINAPVSVCPIADDAAGVAAVKTISVSFEEVGDLAGPASLWIGNREIKIVVAADDAQADVAAALATAINAEQRQPYTASATDSVVTITAKNKGTLGSEVKLQIGDKPSMVTLVIAETTPGSGDPDISATDGALDKCFPGNYTMYCVPYDDSTNLAALRDHIDLVSDGMEQRGTLGVFGYTSENGNLAAVQSLCGTTLNSWRMCCGYYPETKSICYEIAAGFAGVIATQPRPGDPIDDYVIKGLEVPDVDLRMLEAVKQSLLINGVSPIHVVSERSAICMVRTTYTSNVVGGGYIDKLIDFITPRSLDYIRLQVNNMEKNKYHNKKNNEPTRDNLEKDIYWVLKELEKPDFEITQNVDENKDGIIATEDSVNVSRANVDVPADVVPGLHQIVNTVRLL